ncbi:hypothetical protein MAPG_04546 [Magnaporthiopsis poae ATCC 64411]|uniref:Gylcosyl hydrolase 115 C-terminal domain-containing protein n=1 Tax=Magnaporthiopsis poae (strain ATCC 64411 / 73-15) TaxID=644358 RepID=A0A0C4DX10_MAGP6|nr:hypothetical protein MAPG_04546 [Magnaporthiopsis poae ATCC 64411]
MTRHAQHQIVGFGASAGLDLLDLTNATIFADGTDFPGVLLAASDLCQDFSRVTGSSPRPLHVFQRPLSPSPLPSSTPAEGVSAEHAIIVGSLRSPLIQSLGKRLGFDGLPGKWEAFQTAVLDDPFPGCPRALVIAGSDKRGAIYGCYTLSEQIGVSPWYFWADIPPLRRSKIFALPVVTSQGEPSVTYRGVFLNDESPCLTGWVLQKYGGYNHKFYRTVYELLLRLKRRTSPDEPDHSFLWPAMWPGYPNPGAIFFTDDPENARLADEMGIVISTSHHEPMQRATSEWFAENPDGSWDWTTNSKKIAQFFEEGIRRAKSLESYVTLGMRGEYDKGMNAPDPAAVIADVLRTQRRIFKEAHGREDAVPQLLALYKEVQTQFDSGRLGVPEDVTLLFSDDNFGSIRRLPTEEEMKRKGGAGIYYHFEYVGHPRSYKWINPNGLGKIWHQLNEAHTRCASRIWVFNIGDIKPMELPLTFAMKLAWNIDSITPDGIESFYKPTAESWFGDGSDDSTALAQDIAAAWHGYDRLVSLRRHEHIEPTTFSLLHYGEAETVARRWSELLVMAENLHSRARDEAEKAAVFQLVLHPIKASQIFILLQMTLARNQKFARQRRNTTNAMARKVLELFDADFTLSEQFHELLDGKWNHIMSQPHMGYGDTWHAPSRDMISGLCYVQTRQNSNPIVGQMGVAVEGHEGVRAGRINEESERTHPSRRDLVPGVTLGLLTRYGPSSRFFDIFTRGTLVIHWTVACAMHSWVRLSQTEGSLDPRSDDPEHDARIHITIDWDLVPDDFDEEVLIDVRSQEGDFEQVHLPIAGRRLPSSFKGGFVEADGHIAMPATAARRPLPARYQLLPDLGRTMEGAVALLRSGTSTPAPSDTRNAPLEYKVYVFSEPSSAAVLLLYLNMTLDLDPAHPMSYAVQVDDGPVGEVHRLLSQGPDVAARTSSGDLPEGWREAVQDCAWLRRHELGRLQSGEHTVRVWLGHSNLVLEKIVIDLGGVKPSYLGPPAGRYIE